MLIPQTFIEPAPWAKTFCRYIYDETICYDGTEDLVGDWPQRDASAVEVVQRAVGIERMGTSFSGLRGSLSEKMPYWAVI